MENIISMHGWVDVCMYAFVCLYVCMHVCMYACMYACMHACFFCFFVSFFLSASPFFKIVVSRQEPIFSFSSVQFRSVLGFSRPLRL